MDISKKIILLLIASIISINLQSMQPPQKITRYNQNQYPFTFASRFALRKTIDREIEILKKTFHPQTEILFTQQAQQLAPTLWTFLNSKLETLANKTNMQLPKLILYVGKNVGDSYNATAYSWINKIRIGEGLVKLFTWNPNKFNYISVVLAHELGHICYNHFTSNYKSPVEKEKEADIFAVNILNSPDESIEALEVHFLAYNIYYLLINETLMNLNSCHHLARIVAHRILKNIPHLAKLGEINSDACQENAISYAIKLAIDNIFNYRITGKVFKELKLAIYNEIYCCCHHPKLYYEKQNFLPPTLIGKDNIPTTFGIHPTLFARKKYILQAIESKNP